MLTATAAPVLDLFILYNAMKDRPITKVLIDPNKTRNSFRERFPVTSEPMTAA